jgi:CRP-like cAMP-binding protein
MRGDARIAALRASGHFAAWDERSLQALLLHFDGIRVRAGDVLAVEGELCHQLVVVIEGRLEQRCRGLVRSLGVGESVGWSAMRARGIHDATVAAATDSRLLVMSHAQFRAAESPPPKSRFHFWALPTSRRSLPHRPGLQRA